MPYLNFGRKICTKCRKEKSLSEFYLQKGRLGGYRSHCKVCVCEKSKKWRENRSEEHRNSQREKFRLKHRQGNKIYCLRHPEKRKIWNRTYYYAHIEQIKERRKKWLAEHPKYNWDYEHTENGKATARRRAAKRREMCFVPANEPFDGAEAHHIDKERVVFIPKNLHRSIAHSVLKNINMEEINELAHAFLAVNPQ